MTIASGDVSHYYGNSAIQKRIMPTDTVPHGRTVTEFLDPMVSALQVVEGAEQEKEQAPPAMAR